MPLIAASIVVYKNKPAIVHQTLMSLISCEHVIQIIVFDNSPTDKLKAVLPLDKRVIYIFNNSNIGLGKAQNLCIKEASTEAEYFLILNPDVYFEEDIFQKIMDLFDTDPKIALVAPKVLYPNGELQLSCRTLPSPLDITIRRVPMLKYIFNKKYKIHQLEHIAYNKILNVPFLLGCFLMVRTGVLKEVNGFDERFFLYLEDLDLCRRINKKYKTLYYPEVKVYHHYERASAKGIIYFLIHLSSMIKYFNKWGWFNDYERKRINNNLAYKNGRCHTV